jgi:PAS domain S-box-containing protein
MNSYSRNLNLFLENIGIAAIIFSVDSVITACNSVSEKLFGQAAGGLVGRKLAELDLQLVDIDGCPESKDGFPINKIAGNTVINKAAQLDFGLQFPFIERTEWFRATLQPICENDGELSSLVFTFTGISDLIAARKTQNQIFLAKSEWETTVDAIPDIVTIQDREMRIVRANKAAHDLFGYALGDLRGKKCYEVFHNKEIPCAECPVNQTREDHCSHTGTIYNEILDKSFSTSSFPIYDRQGKIHQFVHVARDVTQLLRHESEKNRLMAAIEQTSESVVISSNTGEIQYVNPAFEQITGYSRDEAIGRNPSLLKSGIHDRQFYNSMWKILLNKQVWRGRLTNRRKDGTLFKEDVIISPVLDSAGKIINYVALKRDITREELLEQQLHQSMKMEALGTLAGGIAHDFNNILSAMMGYGEIARGRLPLDHPARKDIDQVIAGGDRAVDLVKQILTFSRRESYGQFRMFKLQYVIKEVIKLLRPSLPATIELQHEIDNSCRSVFADSGQMYQVLLNLCTNARQSIGDGHGCITIKLSEINTADQLAGGIILQERSGVFLDLEVSDTGCGIEEDILDKIFDPFFSTKKKEQGTGLGLAVVHGIIKKHKGEIHVASKVGVGTTVHIYLAADGGEVDKRKVNASLEQGGNERIMVIDDEPHVAEVLQAMLQKVGYTVTIFNDSIAAVKRFRLDPNCCDLVITDMLMPDMTGVELAREFLGQRAEIPIIILTGQSENLDRHRIKQLGVKQLLLKSIKKEKLFKIIRRILDHGKNFNHR